MLEDIQPPTETPRTQDQYRVLPLMIDGIVQVDENGDFLPDKKEGAMATIVRAENKRNGMEVALKTLKTNSPDFTYDKNQFWKEARLLGKLEHPNIVPVIDAYESNDGEPTIVMKYIRGGTLRDAIGDDGMPAERALPLLREVASAIDYMNRRRILHRDIKPSNIILTQEAPGEQPHAVIADVGVSNKVLKPPDGSVAGTPQYMTPEQIMGTDDPKDPAEIVSEEFAVALVAFGTLTGESLLYKLAEETKTKDNDSSTIEGGDIAIESSKMDGLPVVGSRILFEKGYGREVCEAFDKAFAHTKDKRYPTSLDFVDNLAVACEANSSRTSASV